jgi:hypothetical protein
VGKVTAAAKSEAKAAWRDSWRSPRKVNVAKILGTSAGAISNGHGQWPLICDSEFAKIANQQIQAIVVMAETMVDELGKGKISRQKLSLEELARRLGMPRTILQVHRTGEGKLSSAIDRAREIFADAAKDNPGAQWDSPECRCCTQRLGPDSIDGYTRECWEYGQELIRIDELNRLELQRLPRRASA